MPTPPAANPASDWTRSRPDVVVYIPRCAPCRDTDNEHFLVYADIADRANVAYNDGSVGQVRAAQMDPIEGNAIRMPRAR